MHFVIQSNLAINYQAIPRCPYGTKIDKAISTLETGIAKNPESVYLANNLAWLYLEQDINIDKAFTLAQTAYEYCPHDPSIADTLGWAYYKKTFSPRHCGF